MKILVITNRIIVTNAEGRAQFGNDVNEQGPHKLSLVLVEKNASGWEVEGSCSDSLPLAFAAYLQKLKDKNKDCVFHIHGFHKTFEESIEQAHVISDLYKVGVIVFSWPSQPAVWIGGQYRRARRVASISVAALDKILENLCSIAGNYQEISMNLLAHSLGSYMLEKYIRNPISQRETRLFDNIVLNAPDVNRKGHRQWINKLKNAKQVYATINDDDDILTWSRALNPDRLGSTNERPRSKSKRLVCFDLSGGRGVGDKHEHFGETATANGAVKRFFGRVLHGKRGFPCKGTTFDPYARAYVLDQREEEEDEYNTE
ncbi:MAG: alpha/beta hydrolase [Deltaproteobacteria bacterium]|nr:alpha/beta hydrolase [Deltaproteobacteria bacterium]